MRIIIKPAGLLTLLSFIAVLCFFAFNNLDLFLGTTRVGAATAAVKAAGTAGSTPTRFRPLDLSRFGKTEWSYYGLGPAPDSPVATRVIHKKSAPGAGERRIGPLEIVGTPAAAYGDDVRGFRWEGGDILPAMADARTGLTTHGVGSGFRFTVTPTVGHRQVLRVWVGGSQVRSKLQARLSDGAPLSRLEESYTAIGGGDFRSLYVVTFEAKKPEQRVIISYLVAQSAKQEGAVSLQAVALD